MQINEYKFENDQKFSDAKEEFVQTITKFICIPGKKSLSLSGGIDSRLILSFLIKDRTADWNTHTFGSLSHPDSIISSRMARKLNFSHEIIDEELPSVDQLILMLKDYSVFSMVTNPLSSILNLRFYNKTDNSSVIIDGGFGEIWRQQFANRLRMFGSNLIKNRDSENIFPLLKNFKADVFSKEVDNLMINGSLVQIEDMLNELPPAGEIGLNRWIELFSVRSRLPNYYGPEQARIDNLAVCFMSLAQKDLLNLLAELSDKEKKNGRLFKELIRNNSPNLSHFKLVKGRIVHPFCLSSLSTRIYSKIKSKFGGGYSDKQRSEMLFTIKDYALDLLNSREVRNCDLYDKRKLDRIAISFKNKKETLLELEWWLTFELFRQGVTYK